ncbi:MAG: hypothetical protein KIS94_05670 [Chitinophagales bacterium]|nr:hypothetical protein [Chitinophagales bacterium]
MIGTQLAPFYPGIVSRAFRKRSATATLTPDRHSAKMCFQLIEQIFLA